MTLAETFDTHIKAINTAEQWDEYKAMIMNKVRFSEKGIETWNPDKEQWEPLTLKAPRRGNAIVTQNNKAMKYRVDTVWLKHYKKGDEVSKECYDSFIDKGAPESWFELVEQVAEGQYWKWDGKNEYMFRIQEVYPETKRCDILYPRTGAETQWYINGITEDARKLSTDEIESALIKEAKRRGLVEGNEIKVIQGSKHIMGNGGYKYDSDKDLLMWLGHAEYADIYHKGNWASVVDQTPHIEINGKQIEVEDGTVKISCGDTIEEEMFKNFYAVVNKYDLDVSRNGEQINEQLQQIWDEMPERKLLDFLTQNIPIKIAGRTFRMTELDEHMHGKDIRLTTG